MSRPVSRLVTLLTYMMLYTAGVVWSLISSWPHSAGGLTMCLLSGILLELYLNDCSRRATRPMQLLGIYLAYAVPAMAIAEFRLPLVVKQHIGIAAWYWPLMLVLGVGVYLALMWRAVRVYTKCCRTSMPSRE